MKMTQRLLWRLVGINALAIGVVIVTIACAIHLLSASYFMVLMREFNIAPAAAHTMFLQSIDRYLLLASVTGFIVVILLSVWLNSRLTGPISLIQQAASRIASGEDGQRINVRGCGEIDHLSAAFNAMVERLSQNDRQRKEFIADVAHELRTPLTNIRGYTEGLRDGVIPAEIVVFESLHEESLRLVRLVEDLLLLARADVSRLDLYPEAVVLRPLVEHVLQIFHPRFNDRLLTVKLDISPQYSVTADRQRLSQVFTNLFENALRYSPWRTEISIHAEMINTSLRTVVANSVEGTPEITDAMFERFYRGESSRSRDLGGAGLGLAIVRQLIEAQGGTVGIQLVDRRAEVWFELPLG